MPQWVDVGPIEQIPSRSSRLPRRTALPREHRFEPGPAASILDFRSSIAGARGSAAVVSWLDLSWKSHTAVRCLPTSLPQLADFGEVARCCLHRLSLNQPSDLRRQADAASSSSESHWGCQSQLWDLGQHLESPHCTLPGLKGSSMLPMFHQTDRGFCHRSLCMS